MNVFGSGVESCYTLAWKTIEMIMSRLLLNVFLDILHPNFKETTARLTQIF